MVLAAFIRHNRLPELMPKETYPTEMRTSLELDRIGKRTGAENIADCTLSARIPGEFGKTRVFIEYENSIKRKDEYERRVYWYNTRIHGGEGTQSLVLMANTPAIVTKLRAEFNREDITIYKRVSGRNVRVPGAPTYKLIPWDEDLIRLILNSEDAVLKDLKVTPTRTEPS